MSGADGQAGVREGARPRGSHGRRRAAWRSALLAAAVSLGASSGAMAGYRDAVEAYDNGRIDEAIAEWRRMAEAGESQSQVALADMILAGMVPGAGLADAVALYRAAARQGDPVAQLNLGDFYARGRGVERDPVKAYAWLSLAAAQGRDWAARRRDEIARTLDPARLAAARALAARLRP